VRGAPWGTQHLQHHGVPSQRTMVADVAHFGAQLVFLVQPCFCVRVVSRHNLRPPGVSESGVALNSSRGASHRAAHPPHALSSLLGGRARKLCACLVAEHHEAVSLGPAVLVNTDLSGNHNAVLRHRLAQALLVLLEAKISHEDLRHPDVSSVTAPLRRVAR
jgi:hypothetical protein